MSKALIIAEKPSVAADIARALGGFTKHQEYYESDEYVLSSAVGHLLELRAPEQYDVKRGKWTFTHLPVIPPHFDLAPIARSETRLKTLLKLLKRKDVVRADQRLRRRARRRADLPLHRAGRQGEAAGAPAVAAVDDARRDPRGVRAAAPGRADAAAGRRRPQPLGGRLAGRHQRHARHDRLQQQGRRLLPDHRRPRADADARDRHRARGQDPQVRLARLLGSAGDVRRQGRRVRRPLDRSELQEGRRSGRARRAHLGRGARRGDRGRVPRQDRHRHRGGEAEHPAVAAAVRPDVVAARGQLQVRLLGQDHAVAGAGPVRAPQGADVSADRRARAARGLRGGREEDDGRARQRDPVPRVREEGPEVGLGAAEQARVRQQQGVGPLRHHPHAADAAPPVRGRGQAVRPGGQAVPRGVLPRRRVPRDHAPDRGRGPHLQDRGQGAGRAGLARDLRPRSDGGTGVAAEDRAGRAREDERRQGRRRGDQAAGALHRGDAAHGDGRRRQAHRRRRPAPGDGRQGPRHAGHAVGDHRGPDRPALHRARRQGPAPDAQGLRPDDAAEGPRRPGTDGARNSPASGNTSSRRWSAAS